MSFPNLIDLLKLSPEEKTEEDLQRLISWFTKICPTFRELDRSITKFIVRDFMYINVPKRVVITQQGETGDCFYIIISGSVSVYQQKTLDTDDDLGSPVGDDTIQSLDSHIAKGVEIKQYPPSLSPSYFGNFISNIDSGKAFGELALMSSDCIRTATIVAVENVELLVVKRQVYLDCLLGHQTRELHTKRSFIEKYRLFRDWPVRQKTNLAMALHLYKLSTGNCVVSQGDPFNGLHFLIKGQVKLVIDNYQHPKQFKKLANELAEHIKENKQKIRRTNINETSSVMNVDRKKNDAAEEKRSYNHPKSFIYDLCICGPIDVIGDFEVLLDLDKFFYTATCTENCELLHLETGAFDSFFNRRHRESRQRLCDRTRLKIEQQLRRMPPDAVPLMTSVRLRLENTKSQLMQAKRRLKGRDLVPVKKIVNLPRGPIINNFGPGGLFYIIALQNRHVWEAAAEREMAQRHEASYKQVSLQNEDLRVPQRKTLTALTTSFKMKREDSGFVAWYKPNEMFDKINEVIFDWYEALEDELQIPFGKCNLVLEGFD